MNRLPSDLKGLCLIHLCFQHLQKKYDAQMALQKKTAATTLFQCLDYIPKLLFRQLLPTTIPPPPFGNEVLVGLDEGSREFWKTISAQTQEVRFLGCGKLKVDNPESQSPNNSAEQRIWFMIGRVALLVTFKKAKPKSQSLSRSHIRDLCVILTLRPINDIHKNYCWIRVWFTKNPFGPFHRVGIPKNKSQL